MPPSLGQRLKQAREKRELSLADVAHATRIPAQRLDDLESDNYTAFGSLTYARSFLQTYADFLGVDAHAITAQMIQAPLGGARDYRYLVESLGPWVPDRPDRRLMNPVRSSPPSRSPVAGLVIIGLLLLAVAGVLVAAGFFSEQKTPPKKAEESKPLKALPVDETPKEPEEIRAPGIVIEKDGKKVIVPKNQPLKAEPVGDDSIPKAKPVDDDKSKSRR